MLMRHGFFRHCLRYAIIAATDDYAKHAFFAPRLFYAIRHNMAFIVTRCRRVQVLSLKRLRVMIAAVAAIRDCRLRRVLECLFRHFRHYATMTLPREVSVTRLKAAMASLLMKRWSRERIKRVHVQMAAPRQ